MLSYQLLLAILGLVNIGTASVCPANASYFNLNEDGHPLTQFNVTHTYYRQLILSRDLYTFDGQRCVSSSNSRLLYWINRYQLPSVIRYFDANHAYVDLRDQQQIYTLLTKIVATVFNELPLPAAQLPSYEDYYHHLAKIDDNVIKKANLLIVDHRQTITAKQARLLIIDSDYDASYPFLPIQIHFRSLPYPQSSFVEFVSNRDRRWEVYHRTIYNKYAGNDNDLLYRLRHNLRHTLGLGHVVDRRCLMYPVNVAGVNTSCPEEDRALHRLLCDPTLTVHHYAYQQRAPTWSAG